MKKITVIKKGDQQHYERSCPWVIENWPEAKSQ